MSSADFGSPLIIDGPWGSGKSEFCFKLINLAQQKKLASRFIYVNAFQYDHIEDPLLVLLTSISATLDDHTHKIALVKRAIPLLKILGKVGGKAAVSWLLNANADKVTEEIGEVLSGEANAAVDDGIASIFEEFEQVESNIKLFQKTLQDIVEKQNLVLVIDELDRCRPNFALTLLEKIKHVFEISGVKFIMAVNETQLRAIVKKQYGYEIDAKNYLEKFFKYTVRLPLEHTNDNQNYHANAKLLFEKKILADKELSACFTLGTREFFQYLILIENRSLRDVDKLYNNIKIFNILADNSKINEQQSWTLNLMRLFGVYIYTFHPELVSHIISNKLTYKQIQTLFGYEISGLMEIHEFVYAALLKDVDKNTFERIFNKNVQQAELEIAHKFGIYHTSSNAYVRYLTQAVRILQIS